MTSITINVVLNPTVTYLTMLVPQFVNNITFPAETSLSAKMF
jgi:hypothetical protein